MSSLIKLKIFLFLLFGLLGPGGVVIGQPVTWKIDPEHFSILFEADHIGYQSQLGLFLEGSGGFVFDPKTFEFFSGRVEIQAGSVFSNNDDRDDHLRGRDFLNSRRHPTILFEASQFLPNQQQSGGELLGNLTLLGMTHPIILNITFNKFAKYPFGHRNETIGISASTFIDRSTWGMDYGVSNDMVGNKVMLRFEFEAIQE